MAAPARGITTKTALAFAAVTKTSPPKAKPARIIEVIHIRRFP